MDRFSAPALLVGVLAALGGGALAPVSSRGDPPEHVPAGSSSPESPILPSPGTVRSWKISPRVDMEFVWVPPGRLEGEDYRGRPEMIEIPLGFWLGRHEVTVAQFRAFVEETAYVTAAEKAGRAELWQGPRAKSNVSDASWRNPGFPQTDRNPVVCVDWDDARAFSSWAGGRLPLYREWKHAYLAPVAPSSSPRIELLGEYAWFEENAAGATHPVGLKKSTGGELRDMLGNAWEWCEDALLEGHAYRLTCGGSWIDQQAHFDDFPVRPRHPRERCNDLGFRVVRDP